MEYEIHDALLKAVTKQFVQPNLKRRQAFLILVFCLLIVFVILGSTIGPTPFLAVALIIGLGVFVFVLRNTQFVLLLIFAAAGLTMPDLVIPLPIHPIRPIEWAIVLCLIIIIIRRSSMRFRLPHFLALLFVAISIISFIHVPNFSSDYYSSSKRLYELILIFISFFCGTFLIKYIGDTSSFLVTVLLSNIPLYLIGVGQVLGIRMPSFLEYSFAQSQQAGRIMGPTAGSVIFGLYLINLLAVSLACWVLGTRLRDRSIGAIMAAATVLEIVWSGTRSSLIAAVVIVIAAFVLTRHFKTLLVIFALSGVTIALFSNKLLPLFTHADDTTRSFLWQAAAKLIEAHPWIGIGLYQFPDYYNHLFIVGLSIRLASHDIIVHEQYLSWGMESGIPVLVVGVLLLFSIIFACGKVYRLAQHKEKLLLLAAILATLANIVAGIFDQPLDYPENGVFFFLLAGLALGYAEYIRLHGSHQKVIPHPLQLQNQLAIGTQRSSELYWPYSRQQRTKSAVKPSQPHEIASSSIDSATSTKKTGRSVIFQLLSWAVPIPLIFPMTALLSRYLGPVRYGEYSFTLTYLAVFALLSGTGMDPIVIRQLSRQPRSNWSQTLGYAAGTRLISTIVSGCVGVLLAIVLPISSEQRNLLLVGSITLLFSFSVNGLRSIYSHGFTAEQRVGILSLLQATNRILTAGLVGVVVLFHLPLLIACMLMLYSDLPFFIIQSVVAHKRYGIRPRFNFTRARELLLGSLPLMGYDALAFIVSQSDLLMLMMLAGSQSVGLYALASRITDPLLFVALAYVAGLYPLLCSKFSEGREQFALVYHQAVRIMALAIIPLAIYVSVEASGIVALLGDRRFAAASIAVQLLIWAMATGFFNQLALRACMAANMDRWISYRTFVSVGINILINLILIPFWGIVGAGLAALVSEIIGLCLYLILLKRYLSLIHMLRILLRVFSANLPALAFLLWQQKESPFMTIPVALLLTIVGYVVTRAVTRNDLSMARQILLRRSDKRSSKEVADQPTVIMPRVSDIADLQTTILPLVRL